LAGKVLVGKFLDCGREVGRKVSVVAARQSKPLLFLLVGRLRVTGKWQLGSVVMCRVHLKCQGWQRWWMISGSKV